MLGEERKQFEDKFTVPGLVNQTKDYGHQKWERRMGVCRRGPR